MERKIKYLLDTVKTFEKSIKTSLSLIQMTLLFYLTYKMSMVKTEVLNRFEEINRLMSHKIEKINFSMQGNIEKMNSKVESSMQGNIEKMNSKVESLNLSNIEFIQNTKFEEGNKIILKMLELQNKTALNHQIPAINIINESSTKPLVIGSLIIIVVTISCICWFGPKIICLTTTQLGKINQIILELLRYLPGSNNEKATTF